MPEHERSRPPVRPTRPASPSLRAPQRSLPIDPDLEPADPGEPSVTHHPQRGVHRAHPRILGAIFLGGAFGTWARYGLEAAWPPHARQFPAATFVINTSGAFLLGVLLTLLLERFPHRGRHLRPFLTTGVLGGWTTYSTLAVESASLAKGGRLGLAVAYLAATLLAGMVAAALGIGLGRSRVLLPPRTSGEDDAVEVARR